MSGRLACVMPRVVAATSGFLLGFQCNTRFETSQPWGVYWCHAPVLRGLALWMPIRLVGRAWTSDDGLQHGSGFDPLRHLHADGYASACWHRQLPACGAVVSDTSFPTTPAGSSNVLTRRACTGTEGAPDAYHVRGFCLAVGPVDGEMVIVHLLRGSG